MISNTTFTLWISIATVCLAAISSQGQQTPKSQVHTQMRNVLYHYSDTISVHIYSLDGAVVPTHEGSMVVFDDPKSFLIAIDSAKISISAKALSNTLNQHVFAAKDAPLKDVEISMDGSKMKVKGKLHAKDNVRFETEGTLSVTPDGKVRVHSEKVKAVHLPVKGLMDLLGVDIAKLISSNKAPGVRAEQNDLILEPSELLPLPRITGKLSKIQVSGNAVVQTFGDPGAASSKLTGNYMSYRGGVLRFGKLTMQNSDMDLLDLDAGDAFDFFLDHYGEQLSAGYTKITPQFGLRVYMRDYNKLHTTQKP
jgi:hypothetical protein